MDELEKELKIDFLTESVDLLDDAEESFLQLEDDRENSELHNQIFRLAHNLKGTSRAVGFEQLAELTHIAENLILKVKEGETPVTDSVISTLLEFKDKIKEMVDGLKDDLDATFDIGEIQERIKQEIEGGGQTQEPAATQVEVQEMPAADDPRFDDSQFADFPEENSSDDVAVSDVALASLAELGMSVDEPSAQTEEVEVSDVALASLAELGMSVDEPSTPAEEVEVSDVALASLAELGMSVDGSSAPVDTKTDPPPAKAAPKKATPAAKSSESDESIRVKLTRIDKINNIIGELVILQTVVSQRRYQYIDDDLSNKSIGAMGKLFKEVQEIAMSLRMLPLKGTFQKMNRIVRDVSKTMGKDVKLHMIGEETEVDKTVLEKLADPLVHIIRNAVDHGLESNEDREALGKGKGNVELMAYHEGSNLVIQVTDDGKGIDPDIIRRKAIEKKVISPTTNMTDQQVIQLIFHPGFSTKEQVTEVSGRGVGMDVVKTNIEGLGGEVVVMSKMGQGSSFKIILPLTLAIIEGIVISAQAEKFVLPLSQVYEIIQVKGETIETFSGVARLFKLRGEVLPLFRLNSKLGEKPNEHNDKTVIIVRGLSHAFGVEIDDIINQQQIVIKNLGEDVQGQTGIIGSAIMADGRPSLIIDLFELFKNDLKDSQAYRRNIEKIQQAS